MSLSATTKLLASASGRKSTTIIGSKLRQPFSSAAPSAASRLIQRRATTGSVSSVFYLKNLPTKGGVHGHHQQQQQQQKEQAAFVENVFTGLVGLPIACLGLGGLYRMASDGKL